MLTPRLIHLFSSREWNALFIYTNAIEASANRNFINLSSREIALNEALMESNFFITSLQGELGLDVLKRSEMPL